MTNHDKKLRAAAELARDNIASLMAAYPDRYPRHAFQGTHDALDVALKEYVGASNQLPMFVDDDD